MDLSGIIFVLLALGWAGYLIPKALQHQDELSLSRPVDSFSDSVRVLGRGAAGAPAPGPGSDTGADVAAAPLLRPKYAVSRAAARAAARRRRRVLGLLVLVLLATVATSVFAVTPWWSTAVPTLLVAAFLLLARTTVRRQLLAALHAALPDVVDADPLTDEELDVELDREDTAAVSRDELAAAVAAPNVDEGSLWDPLPVTLPTYVTKPRARRTVRTIELTQNGVTSSGHDHADTTLAREAARAERTAQPDAPAEESQQRRASGA